MQHGSWGAGPLSPGPPAHPSPSEGLDWALPRKEPDCHPQGGGQGGASRWAGESPQVQLPETPMSCSTLHTVGAQQDFEPETGSDLSRCVLERPGVTSLHHILGERCPAQHPMAVGCLLLSPSLRPRGAMFWASPISLVLCTVSPRA